MLRRELELKQVLHDTSGPACRCCFQLKTGNSLMESKSRAKNLKYRRLIAAARSACLPLNTPNSEENTKINSKSFAKYTIFYLNKYK